MKTFFDSDKIECINVKKWKLMYPNLNWDDFSGRTWEINNVQVMAYLDFLLMEKLSGMGELLTNIEDLPKPSHCSVCRDPLLITDIEYTDYKTGDILCNKHAYFDPDINGYRKKIF